MPARLQIRLSEEQLGRWQQAARSSGISLADFVRGSVESRIKGSGPDAAANKVANIPLPEFERMLDERLGNNMSAPSPVGAMTTFATPTLPQGFDPQCDDAHMHRAGVFCASCRGSS